MRKALNNFLGSIFGPDNYTVGEMIYLFFFIFQMFLVLISITR